MDGGQNDHDGRRDGEEPEGEDHEPAPMGPLQIVGSVLAAALGVQSSRNRERDFRSGRLGTFIVAGILFTALFIGAVILVVKIVVGSAA
jgi:hypothetical protein